MSAQKKPSVRYNGPFGNSPSPEKKAIDDLTQKINGLLAKDPRMARKAALILEHWLRQKSK